MRVVLLVAGAIVLAAPAAAPGQLPQLPDLPAGPPLPAPAPSLPPAPVPVPDLPKVPVPDLPKVPVPDLPRTPVPVPGASSPASPAATGGGGTSAAAATGSAAASGAGRPTAAGAGARNAAVQTRRSERRLRRTVARLGSCLGRLPAGSRRVLALRAGLGAARAHSRRAVARELDITLVRVRRLERSGLQRARALLRGDTCGGGTATGTTAAPTPIATGGDTPERREGGEQPAARELAGADEGAVRGEADTQIAPLARGDGTAAAGGVALALALVLFALAALAGYATPHLRGRLRSS